MSITRKLEWFAAGAAALDRIWQSGSARPPGYGCPLCCLIFPPGSVESGALTAEHVPAGSVGGDPLVLTCKACNNNAGGRLESALKPAEAVIRFGTSDALPIPATWTMNGIQNRGMTTFDGQTWSHMGIPLQNDPRDIEAALAGRLSLGAGDRIEVLLSQPANLMDRAARAWMRSAYLVMFAFFGYSWTSLPGPTAVRACIAGDGTPTVVTLPRDKVGDGRAVFRIASPQWLAGCYAVVIDRKMTFMPGASENGTGLLERYREHQTRGGGIDLTWAGDGRWTDHALYGTDYR